MKEPPEIPERFKQLDQLLAAHAGPWILGPTYSALDPFVFTLSRWTRGFTEPASKPARDYPQLGPYLRLMLERPAVQQVLAAEQLQQPWI